MRIQMIAKCESDMTGTSRYARNLHQGLKIAGVDARLTFPSRSVIPTPVHHGLKRVRLDLAAFFASYPLRANLDGADVYHLTGQMLATLLFFQRFPKPVVVTVLDIIPYLVRRQPKLNTFRHPIEYLFYRLALTALWRADALIAISEYTKRTLVEALGLPAERIHVIYPGIDHTQFCPSHIPDSFRSKYGLTCNEHYILFVGSEDPRKNLTTLIQAFAQLKAQIPAVKLLKVGTPQFSLERERLRHLIAALNLERDVRFFEYVPDEDLPLFYNLADVFAMPSLYEGFGLPAAEAMACGTPVICSRAGSLPEVVGDGGIQVCPGDSNAIANALLGVLTNHDEQIHLKEAAQQQAARFNLQRLVSETQAIYAQIASARR